MYQTAIKRAKTRQGSNNTCSFAARGFVSWQLPFDDLRERERESAVAVVTIIIIIIKEKIT
jgi:hypothetical protein